MLLTCFNFFIISLFCCLGVFQAFGFRSFRGVKPLAQLAGVRSSQALRSDPNTDAAAAAAYDFIQTQGEWYSMGECSVLLPRDRIPKSIVHFVGGFVAGSAVTVTYGKLLTSLANSGHLIIATPIPAVDLNHGNVAAAVSLAFSSCYKSNVLPLLGTVGKDIPIFGLSHSLGGKLTVLMNSKKQDRKTLPPRAANVYLAFNNYGIQENIELGRAQAGKASPEVQKVLDAISRPEVQQLFQKAKESKLVTDAFSSLFSGATSTKRSASASSSEQRRGGDEIKDTASAIGDVMSDVMSNLGNQLGIDIQQKVTEFTKEIPAQLEFIPDSEETWQLLQEGYNVQNNYMVKFDDDEIDQSIDLAVNLRKRGCDAKIKCLPGNHVTPNVQVAGVGGDTASTSFLRDMVTLFNDISDTAWTEIESRRNEKLMLPTAVKI